MELGKYMVVEKLVRNPLRKTDQWMVLSVSNGDNLGVIRWYGPWRQYCFFPSMACLFSAGCLQAISQFIREEMEARRG